MPPKENNQLEIDEPLKNPELEVIVKSLKNSDNTTFKSFIPGSNTFAQSGREVFRLEKGLHKGDHYEIQRNGKTGKTSVAVVKGIDGLIELINGVPGNDGNILMEKYCQIVNEKLSLSANRKQKIFINLTDVKEIMMGLRKVYG